MPSKPCGRSLRRFGASLSEGAAGFVGCEKGNPGVRGCRKGKAACAALLKDGGFLNREEGRERSLESHLFASFSPVSLASSQARTRLTADPLFPTGVLLMTRPALLCACALLFVAAGCKAPAEDADFVRREVPAYSIQDFLGTVNYTGASFSPDNKKLLVSSNETGIYNAYVLNVDGSGRAQLTQSTGDAIFALGFFPEDERILYTSDQRGNELNHLYVYEPDGDPFDLTPGEGLKAVFYGWAQDDEAFYLGTNERDQRYFDVYEVAINDYKRTLVFENNEGFDFAGVSPDRRTLALARLNTNADSDLYLYDRDTQALKHITPHEGDILYNAQGFSLDGRSLYYLTDKNSEFLYLERYELDGGAHEPILRAEWDIAYAYFSKQHTYLIVGINNDARTELRVYDAETMEPIALPAMSDAEISSVSLSRDEQHMAFYASSSRMPGDLFYYTLTGGAPLQLTRSLNPSIDPADLVDGNVVRFASLDGLEVPGILYRPHQADADHRVPALVWVHGGPGGQSRIGYSALIQYLVNHGYAVYAINNRGSSGYGKTYFHLDDRKHGSDDLDDCVASKEMLTDTGYVLPGRIGIIGGSYGGYMTLAALTFRPETFAVGVDLFGISNWVRTLESIPPWWESFRKVLEKEMGPFDDMDFFRAKSPLFHAENIVRPLMVLQGANDPRVIKEESDDIVNAVRANGVPVEYVLFDDEGHGFVKKENQARGYEAILGFLNTYLKPSTDTSPVPAPVSNE